MNAVTLVYFMENHITHFSESLSNLVFVFLSNFKHNTMFEKKQQTKFSNLLYEGHQPNFGLFGSNNISTTFESKRAKIPEEQCIQILTSNIQFLAYRLCILALSRGTVSTEAHWRLFSTRWQALLMCIQPHNQRQTSKFLCFVTTQVRNRNTGDDEWTAVSSKEVERHLNDTGWRSGSWCLKWSFRYFWVAMTVQ